VLGLGVAYAGSRREDVRELLSEKILSSDLELSAMASLALSLVFHSTLDGDIQSSILQQLMEHTKEIEEEKEGNDLLLRIFAVSLGVLALKQRDSIETLLETVSVLESEKVRDCVKVALIGCAYVGSGNVLKTQLLLNDYAAVPLTPIALSLIAIQDVIGGDLLINKLFLTLFHYSPVEVKRMIPLAISLLSLSNPQPSTIDLLSKYSHDHDADTATSAIISMGLLGGGSNNARLAQLMRQLAGYYHKDQAMLFVVRIAQGLLHMGKGVLSLGVSRYGVLNYDAVVGVLVFCCLVGGKMFETRHYFTYLLVLAIHSRYLITIKGEDEEIKTAVRVGKGVEAKAGRVRITGFQTHDTPVLLGCGEIAELVEYDDCGVVEGVVVVKKKKDGEVVV
jgi:26S proteasome regulatory subunit N1